MSRLSSFYLVFTLRVNAYNREHARELFFEMGDFPDDESWEIISITREEL
jgi:hypothetical protein